MCTTGRVTEVTISSPAKWSHRIATRPDGAGHSPRGSEKAEDSQPASFEGTGGINGSVPLRPQHDLAMRKPCTVA